MPIGGTPAAAGSTFEAVQAVEDQLAGVNTAAVVEKSEDVVEVDAAAPGISAEEHLCLEWAVVTFLEAVQQQRCRLG